MGDRTWDFEGGASGADLTTGNGGTGLASVVKDAGNEVKFDSTGTGFYGAMAVRIKALISSATGSMFYLTPDSITDPLLVFSVPFKLKTNLTASTSNQMVQFRTGAAAIWSIRQVWVSGVATLNLFVGATDAGQIGTGSLTEGDSTWYRVEGTMNGTTGAYAIRLRDGLTDALIGSAKTGTNASAIGQIASVRVGSIGSVAQELEIRFDEIVLRTGSTTPIDPPSATPVPLDTPVVTVGTITPPSVFGATDGSVQVSWPAVTLADHYEAGIADGHDATVFTTTSSAATSPYTFTGLGGGDYTVAIRAIPA